MGPLKPNHRALTLVETIIAIFILIAGFLVMGAMFHVALQHTARMEARQLAVVLAEKKLEEIKGWSAATHRSTQPFSNWSGLAAAIPSTDPDYPGYTIAVTAVDPGAGAAVLFSPCSQFEAGRTDPRLFTTASVRPVRVVVTWSAGQHELVSLVGPRRPWPGPAASRSPPGPIHSASHRTTSRRSRRWPGTASAARCRTRSSAGS